MPPAMLAEQGGGKAHVEDRRSSMSMSLRSRSVRFAIAAAALGLVAGSAAAVSARPAEEVVLLVTAVRGPAG